MRFLYPLLALILTVLPLSAQELFRGTAPDWVQPITVPDPTPALLEMAEDGQLYVLSDQQVAWAGEERFTYQRTATKVTERAGLEATAAISIDFDPAFEVVTLTRLVVIRDGVEIDQSDLAADVFRRETQLEDGILDGTLTAFLQVKDLRVGDVVDYAYVRRSLPMVKGGSRGGMAYLEYSVPVAESRLILNWPTDWPTYFSGWPKRVEYKQTPYAGGIRHQWVRLNHVPVEVEENTPIEYDNDALIRYSADADWAGIVGALSPYYMADYPLGQAWDDKVNAIRNNYFSDGERAVAALRAVQEELRYVSLSIGAGGIFARKPEESTASGFGDCKDKALLLRVMLDRLGIEAYVALTDIDEGYALPKAKPYLGAFDHAIVRATVDGVEFWMDPTMSHQGGDIYSSATPDYGFALPLTGDQQVLQAIAISPDTQWSRWSEERFNFTLAGVFLGVTTVFQGEAADSYRDRVATTPKRDIERDYLDYYAGLYPGTRQVLPLGVTDDLTMNQITVEERYFLPGPSLFENGLREDFGFGAEDFADNLPDAQVGARVAPMFTGSAATFSHTVTITNAPISFTPPEGVTRENAAFNFYFEGWETGTGGMTLQWTFTRKGPVIRPDDVAAVLDDADVVEGASWFTWDLRPEVE
jgi:transglutaminase-like putative cysteine protease